MYDFKNIKWVDNNTVSVRFIYIDKNNCKIYKKYKNRFILKILKNVYKKINNFDFVPRMEFFESENIIVEDYFENKLTIFNKPIDYIYQLLNIHNKLKKNNTKHCDYKFEHFYLKNNKIMLIDWNLCSDKCDSRIIFRRIVRNDINFYILYYSLDYIFILILIIILFYFIYKRNLIRKN